MTVERRAVTTADEARVWRRRSDAVLLDQARQAVAGREGWRVQQMGRRTAVEVWKIVRSGPHSASSTIFATDEHLWEWNVWFGSDPVRGLDDGPGLATVAEAMDAADAELTAAFGDHEAGWLRVRCPGCNRDVATRSDGTRLGHYQPDSSRRCRGSQERGSGELLEA